MTLPLEGIRILDMSRVAPGAYATMILGDLGAEVIKIEQAYDPGNPPVGSGVSPMMGEEGEREAAYQALNRNKKSIVLNLKAEEARQIFYQLAREADVIMEVFRPGVVKRLGVDYETISKINPRIIYCSLTGYGQDGPYQDLPGHDLNYISLGGALSMIGPAKGPPSIPLNLVADYAGGSFHVVMGILAALVAREKTQKGQYVDISMMDGVLSQLTLIAIDYFYQGIIPQRGESFLCGGVPQYNVYETKDGKYISLGCLEHHFWENLCRVLGREDFISYDYDKLEGEKREEIFAFLRQTFLTKTRDEWFELFRDKNIAVGKVYTIDEAFNDPQVLHRQMIVEVPHPSLGKVKQVGIALKLSDTPGEIRSTAPVLGQHTDEILQQLGYNKSQVEGLREKGVLL